MWFVWRDRTNTNHGHVPRHVLVIGTLGFTPLDKRFTFLISPKKFLSLGKVMILVILTNYLTGFTLLDKDLHFNSDPIKSLLLGNYKSSHVGYLTG